MVPRTPILHPVEYFEGRGFDMRPALVVVGITALAAIGPVVALGALATEQFASAGSGTTDAFWFFVLVYVALVLSSVVTFPLVTGAILHVLAGVVCDHDGQFKHTLVVTSWGLLPTVPVLVVALGSFGTTLANTATMTPQLFLGELFGMLVSDASLLTLGAAFLVSGWQTYLYGHGLSVAFDADSSRLLLVGAVVAYGGWLLTLF